MGKFAGRVGEVARSQQPQQNYQGQIDDLQKQYDALGEAAPTANMQWNRQAPEAVAKTIRKEQGVASLPGVKFAETPMMDVYNPAYTDYQKNLNQYNYDKSQFDRNLALENARLAADWSGQRADLMDRMATLKGQQGIVSLPAFGGIFGKVLSAPNVQVQKDPRAQTPQEIAYAKMQEQYANNPLVMKTFAPPVAPSYTPLATTMPTQYQF